MNNAFKRAVPVFITALAIRGAAAAITTATTLNPDSTADAIGFGNHAEAIARGILEGQPYLYTTGAADLSQFLFPLASSDIYLVWGTFLAPFWLLPGPSGFYARLGNALLGAFAIYNVYLLTRYYHSHYAGIAAVLPLTLYPSIVAVQTTLLREAAVLFGITTAARLLILPPQHRDKWLSYAVAAILLHLALLLRNDNVIIFAGAIGAAIVVYIIKSGYVSKRTAGFGFVLSPVAFALLRPVIQSGVEFLAYTRSIRAHERAVYFPEVIPRTIGELVAYSWVGAMYFLYAPFPWMIETVPDLLISIEGLISIAFTIAAIWGFRSFAHKNVSAATGLLVGFAVAVVLYGVGTVNYGTGMRHRQMFLWIIFLFGGVGISEHMRLVWPSHLGNDLSIEAGSDSSGSD